MRTKSKLNLRNLKGLDNLYLLVFVKDYNSTAQEQLKLEKVSVEAMDETHMDLLSVASIIPLKEGVCASGSYRLIAYGISFILIKANEGLAKLIYYQVLREWDSN